jgi:hypothetical protein
MPDLSFKIFKKRLFHTFETAFFYLHGLIAVLTICTPKLLRHLLFEASVG